MDIAPRIGWLQALTYVCNSTQLLLYLYFNRTTAFCIILIIHSYLPLLSCDCQKRILHLLPNHFQVSLNVMFSTAYDLYDSSSPPSDLLPQCGWLL